MVRAVPTTPEFGSSLDFRRLAQSGSAPALGAGCRRFESCISDHICHKFLWSWANPSARVKGGVVLEYADDKAWPAALFVTSLKPHGRPGLERAVEEETP